MLVECHNCDALVHAKIVAEHEREDHFHRYPYLKVSIVTCPKCGDIIVAGQVSEDLSEEGYSDAIRFWPDPYYFLPRALPSVIRDSVHEAERCFKAKAYTATAVMCGRALEGICRHFNTKSKYIGKGIEELRDNKIIDSRLYEWSLELKKLRNIGAHAGEETIERQDAEDIITFVRSIVEYVFMLSWRFDNFKARKNANKCKQPTN